MSEKNYSIVLGEYKGIKRPAVNVTVTDEEVQSALMQEQQKRARLETVNGPAELGHTVIIDFSGFLGEEQFEGGTSENYPLELGSGSFIPGFEEQLVGASEGDSVDVNVTFPENYHAENLAGKPVVFKCKVHKVQAKKLPELNDLFAKRYNLPNIDALRQTIRQSITQQKEQQAHTRAQNIVLDQIVANAQIELTDTFVSAFVDQLLASFTQSLLAQNVTLEQYLQYQGISEDDLRVQMQPQAETTAKASAALETIAETEGLTVTDEEIEADMHRMADTYGMQYEDIAKDMTPDKREIIRNGMLMTKAVAFVMDASVEE
ncbi:MAG: trigger factor [Clostridia bacterium]|nr:trigger factor [Clostridia bacterium]